jgi:hypothetical protein
VPDIDALRFASRDEGCDLLDGEVADAERFRKVVAGTAGDHGDAAAFSGAENCVRDSGAGSVTANDDDDFRARFKRAAGERCFIAGLFGERDVGFTRAQESVS